jgi:hypothetical protein
MGLQTGELGNISQGLATGLNNLLSQKLGEVKKRKLSQEFQATGYSPEVSNLLATLHNENPQGFPQLVKGLNVPAGMGGTNVPFSAATSQKQQDHIEKERAKYSKEQTYLEDLDEHLEEMKKLAKSGKVKFGGTSAAISSIPFYGEGLLEYTSGGPETGEYNTLINSLVRKQASRETGVKSQYVVKGIERAKPSLSKSQKQSLHEIDNLQKETKHLKKIFYKNHPYMMEEEETIPVKPGPNGTTLAWNKNVGKWVPAQLT